MADSGAQTLCARTGKIAYASPAEAHTKLRRVQKTNRHRGALHVYRCEFCRQWHHGVRWREGSRRG